MNKTISELDAITGANVQRTIDNIPVDDVSAVKTKRITSAELGKAVSFTASLYAADSGSTDGYIITLSPVPSSLAEITNVPIYFKANTANTAAATLNVNSLGVKSIVKNGASALETNDIYASQIVCVIYDGTNFQLI